MTHVRSKSHNPEIRKAAIGEVSAISKLALTCCERFIFPGTSPTGIKHLQDLYSEKSLESLLRAGNVFFSAYNHDELIGALAMLKKRQHVFLMFVSERYHRCGYGRALIEHLLLDGVGESRISLNSSLCAIEFYKSLGFTASGPVAHEGGLDVLPMELIVGAT